ncbi:MAG: SagB/ThcOx family dehydrogenase [Anaerolineae bacterium]|nr:SagB/ThcOx family dehydrogenase [Anaerolineae bacterium]
MKNTGKEFVRNTYYDRISASPQELGVPQPTLELPIPAGAKLVELPAMEEIYHPQTTLIRSIVERRSLRRYAEKPLTLAELSLLLYTTQGIQDLREGSRFQTSFRPVPSAGARHALETYLLINRVEGVEPGLYRYSAVKHVLVLIKSGTTIADAVTEACLGQKQVLNSAVTFIWVAVVERMAWRYVERGYRYLYLDAGHVCQNLSLVAESIDSGVCAIAAYDDAALDQVLGLDGEHLFAIYVGALGKKPNKE